ncbi:hypothetical protein D3C87_1177030 [compost metagenome]
MDLDISIRPSSDSANSYNVPRVTFSSDDEFVSIELQEPERTIRIPRETWLKLHSALA